jgi:hypothetical protein
LVASSWSSPCIHRFDTNIGKRVPAFTTICNLAQLDPASRRAARPRLTTQARRLAVHAVTSM